MAKVNAHNVGYSSTVSIEELGDAGEMTRMVILRGPSMPFQGADWGGKNQIVTTFYAGNKKGSQQMLGPQESPSSWTGEWNRTLLGKSPAIYFDGSSSSEIILPMSLWDILEDIFRKGALLRVTWSTHGNEIVGDFDQKLRLVNHDVVREGRASTYKFQPDRVEDIKWSIQFDWIGRGDDGDSLTDIAEDNNLASLANNLDNSVKKLVAIAKWKAGEVASGVRKSASHITLGQLEAFADAPGALVNTYIRQLQANINDLQRIGDLALKIRAIPFTIAHSVANAAKNTLVMVNQFRDAASAIPAEQLSLKDKTADILRAWKHVADVRDASDAIARSSWELQMQTTRRIYANVGQGVATVSDSSNTRSGAILATYITKTGDTPMTISVKFYGNPDRGTDILQANRLPWHTPSFNPGLILIIPVLPTSIRT